MKFSQWVKSPGSHRSVKFREFYQFKQLDQDAILNEMARMRGDRPEFRKTPHLLDGFMLYCLSQIPQLLWAQALSYFQDHGIYALQQRMKSAGIEPNPIPVKPLARQNSITGKEEPYLGVTGGSEDEQAHYQLIRENLKKLPPYEFVTLGKHTFLVVSPNNTNPLAYMYSKIDNSVNDQWLEENPVRTQQERQQYVQQGHGLHGEYLSTFDPAEKIKERYPYHQWAGYTGLSQGSAAKWLKHYFSNQHWYHMASNPNADHPDTVQWRREDYDTIKKNRHMLPRMKAAGRPARREPLVPVLSGPMLQQNVNGINSTRNAAVQKMPQGVRDKWHIEVDEKGESNIEIGIRANHRNIFNTLKIPPQQAEQILQLLKDGHSSGDVAQAVGMVEKRYSRQVFSPTQVIDAIIADKKQYDAAVYPYWDEEGNLHSAKNLPPQAHHPFVQALPKTAPERLVPRAAYLQQHLHQLMATIAKELIGEGNSIALGTRSIEGSDFEKFKNIYRHIPEIKPEAKDNGSYDKNATPTVIKDYAQDLRNAADDQLVWPPADTIRELQDSGIAVEHVEDDEDVLFEGRKKKVVDPEFAVSKKTNKKWGPVIRGMELALFARAFQYWLYHQMDPPFNLPIKQLPDDTELVKLIKQFGKINSGQSKQLLLNTHTADQFDYNLNVVHGKGEDYYTSGWHMGQGDPLTLLGNTEDHKDLVKICEEDWIYYQALQAIRSFLTSRQSMEHKDNRDILVELDTDIAREALSEFQHTKAGMLTAANYIRLRRQLTKEGAQVNPDNGEMLNVHANDPTYQACEQAKQKFTTKLRKDANNFAKRMWQLDMGAGSRRKPNVQTISGGETVSDEEARSRLDGQSYAQLLDQYGAAVAFLKSPPKDSRSLTDRGPEERGQIFSSSMRRKKFEADRLYGMRQEGLAQIEKETGIKLNPESSSFMDKAIKVAQALHTSRKQGLVQVVETAEREHYHKLLRDGQVTGPNAKSPEAIAKEVEEYGNLMAFKHLEGLDKLHTGCPDSEAVKQALETGPSDKWKPLSQEGKTTIMNMQYRIEKDFFDRQGNLKAIKESQHGQSLRKYLSDIDEIADYAQTFNVPALDRNQPELLAALHVVKGEVEKIQDTKKKIAGSAFSKLSKGGEGTKSQSPTYEEKLSPFRFALRRFVALFQEVLNKHVTTIADVRKDYIQMDLESLSDDRVLARDAGWQKTAENILQTKHHHGHQIPEELFKLYAPKIQQAIAKTKRVA